MIILFWFLLNRKVFVLIRSNFLIRVFLVPWELFTVVKALKYSMFSFTRFIFLHVPLGYDPSWIIFCLWSVINRGHGPSFSIWIFTYCTNIYWKTFLFPLSWFDTFLKISRFYMILFLESPFLYFSLFMPVPHYLNCCSCIMSWNYFIFIFLSQLHQYMTYIQLCISILRE
jgi:hypothetical protein